MQTQPLTLNINEIKVENRQRLDLGDLNSLVESIRLHGLIQPIVISQEKRLIAGGRRLEACRILQLPSVSVVFKETMSEDENYILELEENIRRKDETWQEKCLHISTIHSIKVKLKAADSILWTQTQTAELLGEPSVREISHALKMARLLRAELDENNKPKPDAKYWKCDSISAAFTLLFREATDLLLAENAERQRQSAVSTTQYEEEQVALAEFEEVSQSPDALAEERSRYYSNPLNPPDSFDDYWKEKQQWAQQAKQTVHLSSRLINGDSIQYMRDNPGRFDHVNTDIPYAIDMTYLNQQNPHGAINNLDQVEELHDVEYNKKLIADFFPAAFTCMKEKGFCVTWCDQMLWQYMYDHAIKAGFAVQRWPIVWAKNTAMNQCVAYNTTKDTEIAIVCRKKGTTLACPKNTSVIHCGKDDICNEIDHPFAKPFEIWRFITEMISLEGQTILEPFAGRGSGVISMLQLNRNVVGVELDKIHYSHLLENVKKMHYLKQNPNYIFK